MTVREFRFLTIKDQCDKKQWDNWSRCYEYPICLRALAQLQATRPGKVLTVHNTACGGSPLHTAFAVIVSKLYGTTNSDIYDNVGWMPNYRRYDLLQKANDTWDAVLCISTMEHIEQRYAAAILQNLIDQTRPGGRVIVTVDVPPADLPAIEAFVGRRCVSSGNDDMTPFNSEFSKGTEGTMRIAYLELEV